MEDNSHELYYQSLIKRHLPIILRCVGLIIVLAIAFELNQAHLHKKEQEAQVIFEQYQESPSEELSIQLETKYPKQVHTQLVQFHQAMTLFNNGHSRSALNKLYSITSNSQSSGITDIAYLRIARIHQYLNEDDAAASALSKIKHNDALVLLQQALNAPEESDEREDLLDLADKAVHSPFLKRMIAVSHNDNIGLS